MTTTNNKQKNKTKKIEEREVRKFKIFMGNRLEAME